MISLFRLKGRALQLDNTLIITLAFFTGTVLMVTVNFLPVLYQNYLLIFFSFGTEILSAAVNLIFAFAFFLTAFGFYFSISLGIKRYLFMNACKKKPTSRDIFFYFRPKAFFSAYFYSIKLFGVKALVFLFSFLPLAACSFAVYSFSHLGVSALVCVSFVVTAVCLGISGSLFFGVFCSSYFLCDYYFIEGTYVSFRHLVSCSQSNMKDRKLLLSRLKFSFAGWLLLCFFILPIPYVWSYYSQSMAVAAAEFMKGKEH